MSKTYSNHTTQIYVDLGIIGEWYADVIYDWHEANPSNDPLQVPEPAYADVTDVRVFLDGKDISIFHFMNAEKIDELSGLVAEQWQ